MTYDMTFSLKVCGQFKWTNVEKVSEGLLIAGPLHQKRSKFWLFHWPMLILFNLFVTAFLFNNIENKKDKIIPTLRATLISCYCQELTSINNRTENNSYQTTLLRMWIFRLWITIFASRTIKKRFVAKRMEIPIISLVKADVVYSLWYNILI